MSILLLALEDGDVSADQLAAIEARLPARMRLVQTRDRATIAQLAAEIEVVTGWPPRDLFQQLPNLRWLHQWGAGANWLLDYPAAVEMPFVLTNASGIHAVSISEHIFACLLTFGRHLRNAHAAQRARVWARDDVWADEAPPFAFSSADLFELADKTMVLVGVGAIGRRTARLATAFDMRVIGVRRHPAQTEPHVAQMVGPDQLRAVLPAADVLVLTIPLTAATRHMIGAAELALLKPSAILVNIGRGGTIDETALADALAAGRLAGAALDVFEEEPLPAASPLWDLDNVIITSHYSGNTPRYVERALALFLDNLERYAAGRPLRNVVDKAAGY